MLVNLELLVNFKGCLNKLGSHRAGARARDCYFKMAMDSDCAVSNI